MSDKILALAIVVCTFISTCQAKIINVLSNSWLKGITSDRLWSVIYSIKGTPRLCMYSKDINGIRINR